MKGKTHAITGALITTAVLMPPIDVTMLQIVTAGTIGALLPDIDITNSKISHFITHNKNNNPLIQNMFKITILNILGLSITAYTNSIYFLLLSVFLSLLCLTHHRTWSHSLFAIVAITYLLYMSDINKKIVVAIVIGYLVHLIEDMLNITGVPLFYPLYTKKQRIPVVINEALELMFTIIVFILCILKIVLNF